VRATDTLQRVTYLLPMLHANQLRPIEWALAGCDDPLRRRFAELDRGAEVGLQSRLCPGDGINPAPYAIALWLREDDNRIR
jgi:hypothetical protein